MTIEEMDRFDWVKARVECDTVSLFAKLREVVHSDCNSAKEQAEKRSVLCGIVFENDDPNVFIVVTRRGASRIFRLEGDFITVSDKHGKALYKAKALVIDDECLLMVDDKPLQPWVFSRLVLEDLFFDAHSE